MAKKNKKIRVSWNVGGDEGVAEFFLDFRLTKQFLNDGLGTFKGKAGVIYHFKRQPLNIADVVFVNQCGVIEDECWEWHGAPCIAEHLYYLLERDEEKLWKALESHYRTIIASQDIGENVTGEEMKCVSATDWRKSDDVTQIIQEKKSAEKPPYGVWGAIVASKQDKWLRWKKSQNTTLKDRDQ